MKKDNKFGFTLSELLIVLFIVGVIVALTLPSLLKDIRAKSNMNALTSTIDNLQKIIENELTESRAQRLQDTRILGSTEDLEAFMRELNVATIDGERDLSYSSLSKAPTDVPRIATCSPSAWNTCKDLNDNYMQQYIVAEFLMQKLGLKS